MPSKHFGAAVCFVIQMSGIVSFSPNDRTHPAFGDALRKAARAGVQVLALDCRVEPDRLLPGALVPVLLEGPLPSAGGSLGI